MVVNNHEVGGIMKTMKMGYPLVLATERLVVGNRCSPAPSLASLQSGALSPRLLRP